VRRDEEDDLVAFVRALAVLKDLSDNRNVSKTGDFRNGLRIDIA
jgi:hypothetical protein